MCLAGGDMDKANTCSVRIVARNATVHEAAQAAHGRGNALAYRHQRVVEVLIDKHCIWCHGVLVDGICPDCSPRAA